MKKKYMKPQIEVVKILSQQQLLAGSMEFGARQYNVYEDEEY